MDPSNYVFFCSHDKDRYLTNKDRAVFSQWRHSTFVEGNIIFNSCEQYMMYKKAILMNDQETAKKILNVEIYDPNLDNESKVNFNKISYIKKLGREVKNFNAELWNKHKFNIVVCGNLLKFSQNIDLKKILLDTNEKMLVEAAHYDRVWGIGLSETDALKIDPKNWSKHGQNLLGKALMQVREQLKIENFNYCNDYK